MFLVAAFGCMARGDNTRLTLRLASAFPLFMTTAEWHSADPLAAFDELVILKIGLPTAARLVHTFPHLRNLRQLVLHAEPEPPIPDWRLFEPLK